MTTPDGLRITRRSLLTAGVAIGGGLLVGFSASAADVGQPSAAFAPNAFIRVSPEGQVTLILPYAEMGQGIFTSQAQLLAEELEVALESIVIEAARPDEKIYSSRFLGGQITGGSYSIRSAWEPFRRAGAATRMMLLEAAASTWRVPEAECRAERGRVLHLPSGRELGYGRLAHRASQQPVPADPPLKSPQEFKVIGRSVKRLDTPGKVNGTAIYGIDARPSGVRYAAVAACPVFGGKLRVVEAGPALLVAGVTQVVRLDDAVAVVASNTWAARKGLNALKIHWSEGANANLTTQMMVASADAALEGPAISFGLTGDVNAAEAAAASVYEETFRMPLLAHAAMEPINCTIHVKAGSCEIWVGSQILGRAQKAAADVLGIPLENIVVHNLLMGGGFGRRLEVDYVAQAAAFAKQISGPVKICWSREEDIQHDVYRYHNHSRIRMGIGADGFPTSFRHRLVGPSVMARWLPAATKDGVDLELLDGSTGPYAFANSVVEYARNEAPDGLRTGLWRGVGPMRNVFVVESVIDDLAHRAGADPVEFRRFLLRDSPRALRVLNLVAEKSGWEESRTKGHGLGVSVMHGFGSFMATVAEVRVDADGKFRVLRVICAVDCGMTINPDGVRSQAEGSILFGLSSVLYQRITVARGRVEQSNFDNYPVLRMRDTPEIEVHIVASSESPGGMGEPGTANLPAAVTNAIFALTGFRATSLPLESTLKRRV